MAKGEMCDPPAGPATPNEAQSHEVKNKRDHEDHRTLNVDFVNLEKSTEAYNVSPQSSV
jgi:hypothetical protein